MYISWIDGDTVLMLMVKLSSIDGRYTTSDASTRFDRAILRGDEFGLT